MIDNKIILAFFDFEKPCPSAIKNCDDLRILYKNQKELITSKKCTTCTVADFTDHFIKNAIYKNYFNIEKVSTKKIKTPSYNKNIDEHSDVFVPKVLYRKGFPINETTYFGKKYLYVYNKKSKYMAYGKILFSFNIFNYSVYILGRFQDSLKKFKILILNEATHNVIYASDDEKGDEV